MMLGRNRANDSLVGEHPHVRFLQQRPLPVDGIADGAEQLAAQPTEVRVAHLPEGGHEPLDRRVEQLGRQTLRACQLAAQFDQITRGHEVQHGSGLVFATLFTKLASRRP